MGGGGAVWQRMQINLIFTAIVRIIVFILQCEKLKDNRMKITETNRALIESHGFLYHVRAYKNTISIRRSTRIWNRKKTLGP